MPTSRTDRNQTFTAAGVLVSETVVVVDTTLETNEDATRAAALQAIASLQLVVGSTGTLTGLQLSNAVRLMARVILHLVRIALKQHDGTD